MQTATIYTLTNPLNGSIFYVGCTSQELNKRLAQGYTVPTAGLLKKRGIRPEIEAIETCNAKTAGGVELFWMRQFKAWGFPLENKNFGGNYCANPVRRGPHRGCELTAAAALSALRSEVTDDDIRKVASFCDMSFNVIKYKYLKGVVGRYILTIAMLKQFTKLINKRKSDTAA